MTGGGTTKMRRNREDTWMFQKIVIDGTAVLHIMRMFSFKESKTTIQNFP